MQCKLVAELPDGAEWQYQVKYDGDSAFAVKTDTQAGFFTPGE
jgi:hypothetical protein